MAIKIAFPSQGKEFFKGQTGAYTLVGKISFSPQLQTRLNANLGVGSPFQIFWDNMLLQGMEPYIPMLTGALVRSGITNTVVGQGMLTWRTPYARKQFFEGRQPGENQTGILRGRLWAQRAANDKMGEWEESAQKWIENNV